MEIKKGVLQFKTETVFVPRDAEKLRGYMGTVYKEEDLFHNHKAEGGVIYRMPLIQYKVIDGTLSILGINEGVQVLADKFLKIERLKIGDNEIQHFETGFSVNNEEFDVTSVLHEYRFDSLWLPINQKNYLSYINGKLDLNQVLQNNLLTNFKDLDYRISERIMVKGHFKEHTVKVNNEEFFGFSGEFVCNVKIPEFMSVGKNRATGFGTVRRRGR